MLVGVRWAEGAGRSMPSARLGFAWVYWGLPVALWSSEAPVKRSKWREVSMRVVSSADGAGGAPRGWAQV